VPDITLQTLSATETPALWGLSPYLTRWMLYQRFANGVDLSRGEDARMAWGRKLQPLVIAQAAEELRLRVEPNHGQVYQRRGRLGCTRDATIFCPDRGRGALETKCVFDYATWMREWDGGRNVPPMHEIQLQQQMKVGDDSGPYQWGVIAVWVAGDQYYFEREPFQEFWRLLDLEVDAFFASVVSKSEPDPSGSPVEVPWLTRLFPTVKRKQLDLSQHPSASAIVKKVSLYKTLAAQENDAKRAKETLRAELLALARDHEVIALPDGVKVRVSTRSIAEQTRKASVSKTLTVAVPGGVGAASPSKAGENSDAGWHLDGSQAADAADAITATRRRRDRASPGRAGRDADRSRAKRPDTCGRSG
jgi:predicted phage-related endonuclease